MFQIDENTPTKITSLNVRREKHGNDGNVAAIDVNVRARVDVRSAAVLFGVAPDELREMFWEGEAGKPRLRTLGKLELDKTTVAWENKHQIHIGGEQDRVSRLCKFAVEVEDAHQLRISFQCQVSEPTEKFLIAATEGFRKDSTTVVVQPVNGDLPLKESLEGE